MTEVPTDATQPDPTAPEEPTEAPVATTEPTVEASTQSEPDVPAPEPVDEAAATTTEPEVAEIAEDEELSAAEAAEIALAEKPRLS